MRNVVQISNELELCLDGVNAKDIVNGTNVIHEVNPRDVVELNVSLADNVKELNKRMSDDVRNLIDKVKSKNGRIYGGGSLIKNVTDVEPRRYRTTSLSNSCARGFLDITSQQVVIGVTEEKLGFELYDLFRDINPVLLALSASSPYMYGLQNTFLDSAESRKEFQSLAGLQNSGFESRRIEQYERICGRFPDIMWKTMPSISDMDQYFSYLQKISDEINSSLKEGRLDANWDELTKVRDGKTYYPFERLEPHQIYWPIRIRPDHRNEKSLFSIELRIPDMPTTIQRVEMINSLVAGLAYYVADHGPIKKHFNSSFEDLKQAAYDGMEAEINGVSIAEVAIYLRDYAVRGLNERKQYESNPIDTMEDVLKYGNDACLIFRQRPKNDRELIDYLSNRLEAEK